MWSITNLKKGGPLGSEVVTAWEIDPPKDLNQYLYRCDDHFHVDILKDMLKDDNLIGLFKQLMQKMPVGDYYMEIKLKFCLKRDQV